MARRRGDGRESISGCTRPNRIPENAVIASTDASIGCPILPDEVQGPVHRPLSSLPTHVYRRPSHARCFVQVPRKGQTVDACILQHHNKRRGLLISSPR